MKTLAYASFAPEKPLELYEFERREPNGTDVEFKVLFCGVCHSDIHTARGDWGEVVYPCVPGHEIVGIVTRVGERVTMFKPGDRVGVGCMVGSCGECEPCKKNQENYCDNDPTWTYSSVDRQDKTDTKGGYSSLMVAHEKFVLPIPDTLELRYAAPLLCAGITMYSPLKHWKVGKGTKVGIIGLGGLGHMGVKYAKALGSEVWVITTSSDKIETALFYGADGVVISSDSDALKKTKRTFDVLINTIPGKHDIKPYVDMLNVDGALVFVGPVATDFNFVASDLMGGRKTLSGSSIGSMQETKQMLEFSAQHAILPDIEIIKVEDINNAWDMLVDKKMAKRYVIDMEASFQ